MWSKNHNVYSQGLTMFFEGTHCDLLILLGRQCLHQVDGIVSLLSSSSSSTIVVCFSKPIWLTNGLALIGNITSKSKSWIVIYSSHPHIDLHVSKAMRIHAPTLINIRNMIITYEPHTILGTIGIVQI